MEKILIVDDLPKDIQVLGLILKGEGYNVAVVRNQ
jgi:CheY-like chemotaxis protein